MAVTFILGRAGAGKTRHCLDAILAELALSPVGPRLLLIVPEQATFQMERQLALAAPGGGFTRVEVLSFSRLAHRVISESGAAPLLVDTRQRSIALRFVAAGGGPGGEMATLKPALKTQGFYEHLSDLLTELMQERVSPDELMQAADRLERADGVGRAGAMLHHARLARRIREIAGFFAKYLAWLGPGRVDVAMCQELLRARLRTAAWLPEARVWVDGFAGFTGTELATLVELARGAAALFITQLIDPASPVVANPRHTLDPLGLFWRTESTFVRLREQLTAAGAAQRPPILLCGPLPRFSAAPALARLEARIASPAAAAGDVARTHSDTGCRKAFAHQPANGLAHEQSSLPPSCVRVLRCVTHRDELRAAARWIRARLAESGGKERFRDFALIARDLAPFADLVAEVFDEFEIPYFLDRRRPLRGHPLTLLLPALIDAVLTDLDPAAMVRLLRTQLLPVSRAQAEELENLLLAQRVRGRSSWAQPEWELEPDLGYRGSGEAEPPAATGGRGDAHRDAEGAISPRRPRRSPAYPQRRRAILAALEPLMTLDCTPTAKLVAERLGRVLEALGVRRKLERWIAEARRRRDWEVAQTHAQAWRCVCSLLENLHTALADQPLSLAEAREIIEAALAGQTLGLTPPGLDQVLVSAIERSRHPDIRHAWLFAFNEGLFPARPAEDRLLSTQERDALRAAGLEACASHRDDLLSERLLMYIALTRPSTSLTVSFATVSAEGEALFPSPLLHELCAAGGLTVVEAQRDPPPVHPGELAWGYLSTRGAAADTALDEPARRYGRLFGHARRMPAHGSRLEWLTRGLHYRNRPAPLGNFRRPPALPDAIWSTSASEIEAALQCPFQHFAKYGLRLKEEEGPRPLNLDLGNVAHELLATVVRRAAAESAAAGGVGSLPDSRWEKLLDEAMDEFGRRQPADQGSRRPDLVFKRGLLRDFVRDVLAAQVARWGRGSFRPLSCEQAFGSGWSDDALGALEFHLPGLGRVFLRGKIDRIDASADESGGRLLLVCDYKTRADSVNQVFLTGHRLQLHLYMCAVQRALGDARTSVGGGLLLPLYPTLPSAADEAEDALAADPGDTLLRMYRPRGILEERAARRLDRALSTRASAVAHLRLRKDGSFYANCDARPAEELASRLALAERTVHYVAEGIARGAIDVAPLVEGQRRACHTCGFAAFCRFDPAYNRSRRAEAVLPVLRDGKAESAEDEP